MTSLSVSLYKKLSHQSPSIKELKSSKNKTKSPQIEIDKLKLISICESIFNSHSTDDDDLRLFVICISSSRVYLIKI